MLPSKLYSTRPKLVCAGSHFSETPFAFLGRVYNRSPTVSQRQSIVQSGQRTP